MGWLPSKEQALTNGYSITHYNSDNALPQNSITGMAFDKNGFLWLTTQMGIVRFDGKNFREYNTQNSPALFWNEFLLSQQAPGTNRIFIKPTADSSRILTITDDYQIVTDSVISASPHHALIAPNSHLFSYPGIYKTYNSKEGVHKQLLQKLATSHALVTVNERQAYFPYAGHTYFLDENTRSLTVLPEITGRKPALQFMVNDLYFYIDDQYRLLAFRNGTLQKNISCTAPLLQLLIAEAKAAQDPVQTSLKIKRDGTHTLMICKDTILQLRMVNNVLDYKLLAANIPVEDIKCMIYEEDHKILYVGSMTSGLYVLKLHEFERLLFNKPGFAANSQTSQIELPGQRILTCTGILNYSSKDHVPFPATRNFDKHVLFQASDGAIWYSESKLLKKTDGQLRAFTDVKHLGYFLTGIIETENKELIYSNKHQVFRRTGTADTILVNDLGLAKDEEISALRAITPNILWIGTWAGLFTYDLKKNLLRPMPGMEKKSVSVIHVATDSSIWIGTYGQGMYKFYQNQFIKMPMDSRNALVTAHCFMEDRHGYFWIPTNKGLFRVAKKELDDYAAGIQTQVYYYYVDKAYGFSSNEFNSCTPCGIETRDGWFSFPSIDGLVRFNPDSVSIDLPDKNIIIEQVTADDKRIVVKDKLVATQDAGSLIFEISAPYFGNKVNLHLEYAIKELNDKWYPVNADGKLIITNLNSGKYTLTVRSQTPHAHYTYNNFQLTILPYWYEQVWFKCLLGGLAIGTFLLFFRLRYNYQVKRAQLLQQKVDERTVQLSESNRVKELMISAILHDLRSPLRFLHMLARRMYNNHKASADKELSQILFQFENATNEIYDFTQDFFVFTNMQKEGFVIKREKIVLRDLVAEIISLYEMGAQLQKNTFSNLVPSPVTLHTDASLLSLVLRNLVDNANKYTSEGTITIEGIQDATTTRIILTDEGDTMNKELVARILNKSFNPSLHGGWGYKIIIEILDRLHGSLDIVPGNDKGNIITITFENKG
ncbi:sensor histidine kinase [Niastella caeni]|uniref:sensor histidine kinase n=1 Tax=Niastella caeni TaxID=2569763 RepID=UPI001408D583|nr:ATP-binding protein [Niastella caeni]